MKIFCFFGIIFAIFVVHLIRTNREMNLNSCIYRIVKVLAVVVLMSCSSLYAQNLITNGDFEDTGFNYQTLSDYQRLWSGAVEAGHDAEAELATAVLELILKFDAQVVGCRAEDGQRGHALAEQLADVRLSGLL